MVSAGQNMTGLCEMLVIAKKYNMEYEMARIPNALNEWSNEMDDLMSQAIEAGFGPEDFE